jgi:purine-nucleoside phosphorylase
MALYDELMAAAATVRARATLAPEMGVVLGSGLGAFADALAERVAIPYEDIPGFPVSRVVGHAGRLVLGRLPGGPAGSGLPVVVMQGRVHGYEGWTPAQVAFGPRVLCALGVRGLVLTNAAGGIGMALAPGDLVRLTDHLNLAGQNPLTGPNDERVGPRFPDLTRAYDPQLSETLDAVAGRLGVTLRAGVYACMGGPSYETPAEVRMLRTLGADAVGMSTVPEVIAARHMAVPVSAISVITNYAAGIGERPLSHEEVAETAALVRDRFIALLTAYLPAASAVLPARSAW